MIMLLPCVFSWVTTKNIISSMLLGSRLLLNNHIDISKLDTDATSPTVNKIQKMETVSNKLHPLHESQSINAKIKNGDFDLTPTRISVIRNNVYFYGDFNSESCEKLKNSLVELDFNGKLFRLEYNLDPPPINLHIQSTGGALLDSLYLVDLIQSLDSPVNTYVDGYAASAASLLSVVGEKRFMTKNSMILIHQLSSGSQGKYEEMDDNMKNLDNLMEKVKNIYGAHTSIPEDTLEEILKHDLWFDAETCKSYGLVDEII